MKTTEISLWEEQDENHPYGRMISAWGFTLNGENFGGYCAHEADARSDAESVLQEKLDEFSADQIDAAYTQLVGYAPIASEGMSEDDARQLLFERMGES